MAPKGKQVEKKTAKVGSRRQEKGGEGREGESPKEGANIDTFLPDEDAEAYKNTKDDRVLVVVCIRVSDGERLSDVREFFQVRVKKDASVEELLTIMAEINPIFCPLLFCGAHRLVDVDGSLALGAITKEGAKMKTMMLTIYK